MSPHMVSPNLANVPADLFIEIAKHMDIYGLQSLLAVSVPCLKLFATVVALASYFSAAW